MDVKYKRYCNLNKIFHAASIFGCRVFKLVNKLNRIKNVHNAVLLHMVENKRSIENV